MKGAKNVFFWSLVAHDFGNPNVTKVTVHKCAETIQGRKLYEEIYYVILAVMAIRVVEFSSGGV